MTRTRSLRRARGSRGVAVELRPLSEERARAIRSRTPLPDDRWARGYPTEGDHEVAVKLLREMEQGIAVGAFGVYEIVDLDRQLVVGGIGFHGPPDAEGAVEIGYGITDSEAGRGLATAAVIAVLDVAARNDVELVRARALPDNGASRRVLEKAEFTFEGIRDGFACYRFAAGDVTPSAGIASSN